MNVARFLCEFTPLPGTPQARGWHLTVSGPNGWQASRDLGLAVGPNGARFPQPPANDLPAPSDPHHELCVPDAGNLDAGNPEAGKRIDELLGIIASRNAQAAHIEKCGCYLFQTLLGRTLWQAIGKQAAAAELVELALTWPASEDTLHRLPWEMMRGPQGCLASGNPVRVSVTRVVDDQGILASAKVQPKPAASPVRMLFVIGESLTERTIRSGAELFGLLQELEAADRRSSVHVRTVLEASPAEVKGEVADFRPDVVHFICHGDVVDGHGCLLLQLDRQEKDQKLRARDANDLREYLAMENPSIPGGVWLPSLVVLSACQSGTLARPEQSRPLAVELVRLGVPAVVAMAGEVADQACRLFTRAFGEAMLGGQPLVAAVERGRRAVFSGGDLPFRSVDWALPTLFLARGLPNGDYRVATEKADPAETDLESTLLQYDLVRRRDRSRSTFLERSAFVERSAHPLDKEYELLLRGKIGALAVCGDQGTGKKRWLVEIAAKAIRDGQVPVLLASEFRTWTPPTTLDALMNQFNQALETAAKAFLGADPPSQATSNFLNTASPQEKTNKAVCQAFQIDLEALATKAKEKCERVRAANGRPWLLLAGIHDYEAMFIQELFGGVGLKFLLGPYGLGRDKDHRIPVATSFRLAGANVVLLDSIKDAAGGRNWLEVVELGPFQITDDEDLLACSRILLHPHNPKLLKDVSDSAWAFNPTAGDYQAEVDDLRTFPLLPKDFNDERGFFYFWARLAKKKNVLVPATDEDVLAALKP